MIPDGAAATNDDIRRGLVAEGRAVVDALLAAHAPAAAADAGTFLVRWCRLDADSGIETTVASNLARLLETPPDRSAADQWLTFYAEAAAIAGDARVADRAHDVASALAATWGRTPSADAAPALDACFRAAALIDDRFVVAAVDELERIAAARYRPGLGMAGPLEAQGAMASALLSAFEITGRLPYSMLADELVETARRTLWDPVRGGFRNAPDDDSLPFAANCGAAAAAARLARLHDSAEYRRAAVVAEANHRGIALSTIRGLSPRWRGERLWTARYGFAVAELVGAP